MVASSRSSLRRPPLRGDHGTSRSSSPVSDNTPKISTVDSLRSKRTHATSLPTRNHLHKRRKLAPKLVQDEIRIPLRSKEGVSDEIIPAGVTRALPSNPLVTQNISSDNSPLGSPSIKPQYDQIKRIEEKARASIQQGGTNAFSKDDRRRLRSEHGSSRSKTELSQYFPAFDEMLSLEPPNPDILTARTRIVLVDDTPNFEPPAGQSDPFGAKKPLHNVEYIDVSSQPSSLRHVVHDPLSPDVYYKAHRKAERHEKQMKNGDKERAQHEKYQLERLLDELRGPDWLKTLGITGITDSEKKRYEPKRALFVRETKALIDKFKRWKEEEKRRKLEKEQMLLEEARDAEGGEESTGADTSTSTRNRRRKANGRAPSPSRSTTTSSEKGPDSNEIDALASQQLLQEAKSASIHRKKPSGATATAAAAVDRVLTIPEVHKPFTSFFSKRHIRDAAVAGRQRGRTVLAFGEPIPELPEIEFQLPDLILTEDAIRASQRKRRAARRDRE